MATPENGLLALVVTRFLKRTQLTHDERREVLHIARGLASKDSARIERVPVELIRTRRKHIFRKLGVPGASELVSGLLGLSLAMLAGTALPRHLSRAPRRHKRDPAQRRGVGRARRPAGSAGAQFGNFGGSISMPSIGWRAAKPPSSVCQCATAGSPSCQQRKTGSSSRRA